ncbi:hypothetical protein BC937DRAFT_92584, partial [Endogone sp. FLAS-F59071]
MTMLKDKIEPTTLSLLRHVQSKTPQCCSGIFARRHLKAFEKLPDKYNLAACSNRSRDKAEKLAEIAGIVADKVYDDPFELIKNPEIHIVDAIVPIQNNLEARKSKVFILPIFKRKSLLFVRAPSLTVRKSCDCGGQAHYFGEAQRKKKIRCNVPESNLTKLLQAHNLVHARSLSKFLRTPKQLFLLPKNCGYKPQTQQIAQIVQ